MGKFISADTYKIAEFIRKSREVKTEFSAIKREFNSINQTLLGNWKGQGANAFRTEVNHILENIGSVADVLDAINESAVISIRDAYSQVDDELGEYNRNPSQGEGE